VHDEERSTSIDNDRQEFELREANECLSDAAGNSKSVRIEEHVGDPSFFGAKALEARRLPLVCQDPTL
jgi:hypothetical protein